MSLSLLLSHLPPARVPDRGQQRVTFAAPVGARTTTRLLVPLVLVSLGLAGCAGSPARMLIDASNRPGGLLAVVPCRHAPDIGDAVRSAVLVRKPKTCQAKWTHPTATQDQLVEDMTACSKAAFWVLSPSAAQDQRLACMESKGYRRDTQQNAAEPTSAPVMAKVEEAGAARGGASGLEAQLERLSSLRARGDITEDEYMTRRRLLETAVTTPERPAVAAPNTTAQAPAPGLTPMPQDLVTKPIQGAKSIVGTWEGSVLIPNSGLTLYTLTLRENGTWEAATLVPPGQYFGSYTVSAGKARFKSDTTGRTGSYELREGGGRRVLVLTPDGGEVPAFELVPARAREPWRPAKSADDAAKQNACRRQYLEGFTDWRDRLPEYRACLAR